MAGLAWIVEHTFEDGYNEFLDHRARTPLARITVGGEHPWNGHDEDPEHWTPIAFVLELRDKADVPVLVRSIRENWNLIQRRNKEPSRES